MDLPGRADLAGQGRRGRRRAPPASSQAIKQGKRHHRLRRRQPGRRPRQSVKVKVGAAFVAPSAEAPPRRPSSPARRRAARPATWRIDVNRTTTEAGAYPIILISYQIVCPQYDKATDGDLVKAFETYVVSAAGQDAAAKAAGSAPLTDALRTKVTASIATDQGRQLTSDASGLHCPRHGPGGHDRWPPGPSARPRPAAISEPTEHVSTTMTPDARRTRTRRLPPAAGSGVAATPIFAGHRPRRAGVAHPASMLAGVAIFLIIRVAARRSRANSQRPRPTASRCSAYIVAAALRHGAGRDPRAAPRHAGVAGHRAVHLALRAARGSRTASATSSTCSPPSRAWSTACGASSCSPRSWRRSTRWLDDAPRLDPVLRRAGVGHRPHHAHRRRSCSP